MEGEQQGEAETGVGVAAEPVGGPQEAAASLPREVPDNLEELNSQVPPPPPPHPFSYRQRSLAWRAFCRVIL